MGIARAIRYFIVVATFLLSASIACAQVPAILSDKNDVKDIISHFRAEMSALIAQAGGEARVTLLRAFQLSDALINSLSAAYGDAVKLTFGELDKQQQKVFFDAYRLLDETKEAVRTPTDKALKLGNDYAQILADVLSWSKKPMVTGYFPGYIAPTSISDTVRITVVGARLHAADVDNPRLTIGRTDYEPDELTDGSIAFVVPRSAFSMPKNGTTFQRANLTLFRDPSGFWFWKSVKKVTFSMLFNVVPESLGTYSSSMVVLKPTLDTKHIIWPTLSASKGGGGGAEKHDCYVPEAGYKFDLTTARFLETKHTAYKDNDTSPGTNDGTIKYFEDTKTDVRICVQVSAHTGCTECGGTTEGHLEVNIVRTIQVPQPSEIGSKPLGWKDDISIPLVENTESHMLTIKLFDEITTITSASSPRTLQFLKIEPDPRNHIVVLRPVRDWAAR